MRFRWKSRSALWAVPDFARAVALQPDNVQLHRRLAEAHEFSGEVEGRTRAIAEVKIATELAPEDPAHCLALADLLFRDRQEGRALGVLETFRRKQPAVPVLRRLAKWYFDHDKKDEAFSYVWLIQDIDPTESTDPFPRDNFDALVYFYQKTHEAYVAGAAEYKARIAAENAARRAREQALRAAELAERAAQRQAVAAKKKQSWIDQFAEALHNAPTVGDNGFSKMADTNSAAGARLQQNLDTEKRLNTHLHEIERQFTGR